MFNIKTPADQKAVYEFGAEALHTLAGIRTEHVTVGCTEGPLCPGPDALDVLETMLDAQGRNAKTLLILVAIGEVGRLTTENDALARRSMRLEADLLDVSGRLADWENAAAILGPVGEVCGE